MADLVVALDIGTTKVCTLVAEAQPGGQFRLLGLGNTPCSGLRRGTVIDMERTTQSILTSVEEASRAAGVEIRAVLVGVTGEHLTSLNAKGVATITNADREVRRTDVERVIDSAKLIVLPPDREIVQVLPRFFTLDGQEGIKNPIGMCGSRLEVETHLVTGASAPLRNLMACVEQTGLVIEELILEPMASGEAVLLPAERELGVALLDIGGGTTDIAVFRNGEICFSAVVPVGGSLVTRDIAAFLRSSIEEAERVKCTLGCARAREIVPDVSFPYGILGTEQSGSASRQELADVIEARCNELFQLVRKEILRSGLFDALPVGVVICGGGSLLPGLERLAEETLHLPTRLGCVRAQGAQAADLTSPSFATAFGLIQWGARQFVSTKPLTRTQLLNPIQVFLRRWKQR